jgi:ADP-heptose:LPS heptosyltransferase
MQKLILSNPLAPGDILMSTSAFRDLQKAYPGEYLTDVRCPSGCEQIFANSPYIARIDDADPDARKIRLDYSEIHRSGWSGRPFAYAHTIDLAKNIGREIPHTTLKPDIFFSQDELLWPSPVTVETGYDGKYWIINAGIKNDYTLKYYPYYQKVVDLLKDKITFVQVGQLEHDHPSLEGVIDMRGKTDLRQLFRLSQKAEGAICAVSLQMVVMMALEKPCVVVAGGREGVRWQLFPGHRYLYTNGALECCKYDGCWKSKKKECVKLRNDIPLCMDLITPETIASSVMLYYEGGRLCLS